MPLDEYVSGQFPVWVDAGYKFSPALYVGGYLSYGVGLVGENGACDDPGASCSANVLRFGVDAHYHLMPWASFDPWVGVGIGYEITGLQTGERSLGKVSWAGPEFANIQAGFDYRVSHGFGIGPWAMLSIAQYLTWTGPGTKGEEVTNGIGPGSMDQHQWLMIGVRGVYDISL